MSLSKQDMGELGCNLAKAILRASAKVDTFLQADWLVRLKNGEWVLFEVKYQEYYESPDGHGLPPWQVQDRLLLQKEKGIPAYLLIFDPKKQKVYGQWLDKLEEGKSHTTTIHPRKVYPLENFVCLGEYHYIRNDKGKPMLRGEEMLPIVQAMKEQLGEIYQ